MEKPPPPSSSDHNEFEFGCIRETSPTSDPKGSVSPADEFFHNGRLLPHSFPVQPRVSARRTSSSSSRDSLSLSLVSSRSSSASSSRSSTPPSARTSSSDTAAEDRKAFQMKIQAQERLPTSNKQKVSYGLTFQKWQLFINVSPSPVLDPSGSRRRRRRSCGEFGWKLSPEKMIKESDEDKRGFCERVLRSIVKSCKACHAMEDGAAVEDDHHLQSLES